MTKKNMKSKDFQDVYNAIWENGTVVCYNNMGKKCTLRIKIGEN